MPNIPPDEAATVGLAAVSAACGSAAAVLTGTEIWTAGQVVRRGVAGMFIGTFCGPAVATYLKIADINWFTASCFLTGAFGVFVMIKAIRWIENTDLGPFFNRFFPKPPGA